MGAEAPPPPPLDLMIFILESLHVYNVQCISDYETGMLTGFDSASAMGSYRLFWEQSQDN